jgi:VanZ family protein
MASAVASRWLAVGGAILIAAIAADSLVPVAWQVRTGLHWLTEHFLAYFAVTIVFCLALQRPLAVAGVAVILAALMEALQGLTADRIPDLPTALSGTAGALAGALVATLLAGVLKRRKTAHAGAGAGSATSTNVMYR